MSIDYDSILETMIAAAREAGTLTQAHFKRFRELEIGVKGPGDFVSDADRESEQLIRKRLLAIDPTWSLTGEEFAPVDGSDPEHRWLVDPIDGTVNFAHNHPQVAVSIAYYHNGKARVGVVHNPFLNETFHAQAGKGARLNDVPIHCSDKTDLGRSIIATGFPYEIDNLALLMRRLEHVLAHCADIRRLGSAALDICWVACGRLDGYYESVKPWDFAAAQLIAREAGACFGHIQALNEEMNPQLCGDNILISAPSLFKPLQALLADAGD